MERTVNIADDKLSHFTYDGNGAIGSFTAPSYSHAEFDYTSDIDMAKRVTWMDRLRLWRPIIITPLPTSLKHIVIQNI